MWDSKRDTDIKNRLLDSMGEGKGGVIWENSIEICVLSSPSSMYETGHSKPVYLDNPEEWYGEGGARGFKMGDTCTPMADSCEWISGKNHYKIVKQLASN